MRDSPRVDQVGINMRRWRIAEASKNRLIVRDKVRLLVGGGRVCRGGENESDPRKERSDKLGYACSRNFRRFHGLALVKDGISLWRHTIDVQWPWLFPCVKIFYPLTKLSWPVLT